MNRGAPGRDGHLRPCDRRADQRGVVAFTSPHNGPDHSSVGTRLVFSRPGGLGPGDLTLTADGLPVIPAAGPNGTPIAVVSPPADVDLGAGGTYVTPFTATVNSTGLPAATAGLPEDALVLTAELLAQGYEPLQPTGVIARTAF